MELEESTLNRNLTILGSTGSIGLQTLEVVDRYPAQFRVRALAAADNIELLVAQVEKYRPDYISWGDVATYSVLRERVGNQVQIRIGAEGMAELAALPSVDTVMAAVSGAVGITAVMSAIKAGKRIALANKETLVAAGEVVMAALRESAAEMIPVDSEHSAIYQCLRDEQRYLKKLWITASGGPFLHLDAEKLKTVRREDALRHPNWNMGPKITVDSSTLMNKGLEVIEAHHLFAMDYDLIEVLVQPESVIHSMVEFIDGSFLGHLGKADMRVPIQYALSYPQRQESPVSSLDFFSLGSIHFERPDLERFPCLSLALAAGRMGGTMPAVMNATNEVAVQNFLAGRLEWWEIAACVEKVMARHQQINNPGLDDILAADQWARETVAELLGDREET